MSNMTRRGFLGTIAALAASTVLPATASASTWFKLTSSTTFKLNQPRIIRYTISKSGVVKVVKYGNPISVLRAKSGIYAFYPACSKCGRELKVTRSVLKCGICGSNFNPRTGGPIVPSAATRGLRKIPIRVRSGQVQFAPFG